MNTTAQPHNMESANGQTGQHHNGSLGELKLVPVKVSVHIELGVDGALLVSDPEKFQQQLQRVFQIFREELARSNAGVSGPSNNGATAETVEQLVSDLLTEDGEAPAPFVKAAPAPRAAPAVPAPKAPPHKPEAPDARTDPKKAGAAEPGERLPARYWVAIGLVGFLAISYLFSIFFSGPLSPRQLAESALSRGEIKDRIAAVVRLAGIIRTPDDLAELRRVAKETKDPEVLEVALNGLIVRSDSTNINLFFDNLDNAAEPVRQAAFSGLIKMRGVSEEEFPFVASAPANERTLVVQKLRELEEKRKQIVSTMKIQ